MDDFRPKIQDLILALHRAEQLEGEGNLRPAIEEIQDSIKILQDEENRLIQKRRFNIY